MERENNVTNISETEVFVKERKHPIKDFVSNHPTITTIVVGVLAALGGYTVGNLMSDSGESDDDWIGDPVIDTEATEVTE